MVSDLNGLWLEKFRIPRFLDLQKSILAKNCKADKLKLRITGPEATGKSTLAKKLSKYFSEPWVPEAARFFLEKLDRPYVQSDLDIMLQLQLEAEEKAMESANKFTICDTGPEVFWVWSKFKYGNVSPFIESTLGKTNYNQTFLMDIDLPWEPDPLRENPDLAERRAIFNLYFSLFKEKGVDFEVISGNGHQRFQNALKLLTLNP